MSGGTAGWESGRGRALTNAKGPRWIGANARGNSANLSYSMKVLKSIRIDRSASRRGSSRFAGLEVDRRGRLAAYRRPVSGVLSVNEANIGRRGAASENWSAGRQGPRIRDDSVSGAAYAHRV